MYWLEGNGGKLPPPSLVAATCLETNVATSQQDW